MARVQRPVADDVEPTWPQEGERDAVERTRQSRGYDECKFLEERERLSGAKWDIVGQSGATRKNYDCSFRVPNLSLFLSLSLSFSLVSFFSVFSRTSNFSTFLADSLRERTSCAVRWPMNWLFPRFVVTEFYRRDARARRDREGGIDIGKNSSLYIRG